MAVAVGGGLMVSAIAQYLPDFGPAGGKESSIQLKQAKAKPEEKFEDTASLIQAAEERGRAEGHASAKREFDAALAAERTQADRRIAEERLKWAQEEAAQFVSQLAKAMENLETRLADNVARIMTPFLGEMLREQTLAEFKVALAALLSERQAAVIRVSGPEDLLSALESTFESCNAAVEYTRNDKPDVAITLNETVIETQLEKWIGRLAEAVRAS
jgi:hypothetical protein